MTSHTEPSAAGLYGRDHELAACDQLFEQVRRRGGVLLLRGPAGIGKTSILDAARRRADALGFRVLSTAGAEAERTFAFAALQPLLLPVIEVDAGMPEHLNAALLSALGLRDTDIPAAETVGLAVLGLLSGLATEATPLCVVADDVHWLDASTAAVLRFLSRRLSSDPIVLLAAGRDSGWPPAGALPEMSIEPLDPATAEALLVSRHPTLPVVTRQRVLAEAAGNPLGIVELSGAMTAARRDHLDATPGVLPLTERLEQAFAGRVVSLSEETRTVLLVAALAPGTELAEVLEAATALLGAPLELATLDAAVRERLVDVAGRHVRFRHPLVRSSLVHAATPSLRRAAHQALAAVIQDRSRCLYHRAEASVGYDDGLAGELEAAAELALRRGSPASAVVALQQAADLTVPGPARDPRLIRAAQLHFELGQADDARRLLTLAHAGDLGRTDRALTRRLTVALDGSDTGDPRTAWELIALAEEAIAAGDHDGALELLQFASHQIQWSRQWAEVGRALRATARKATADETDPRVISILAQSAPIEAHHEVAARLDMVDDAQLVDAVAQQLIGVAALLLGDLDRAARLLDRAERQLRQEARLAVLGPVLFFRGIAAFGGGQWQLAEQVLDETERLTADTVQQSWLAMTRYVRAGIAGMCGDEERLRRIIDELAARYRRTHSSHRDNHLAFMRGIAATMQGRHDDALALLGTLFEPDDPTYDARTCSDSLFYLADSAAAKDRPDLVEHAIKTIEATVPTPLPLAFLAAVDYARAVTADDTHAEQLFEAALTGPAGNRAFDRARTQLAYGRWLRHHHQHLRARELLRAARISFDHLGNDPFARRAREELRAAGEASPQPRNTHWGQLSPQEAQIARLVVEGLSNKEIGERLFLSHRTVASHLYRMFPKLGVTSRAQLVAIMRAT